MTMDEVAAAPVIDPTLLALLSIFGGALLTVLAGLFGAWIQSRREHRRWLRERQLEAFSSFLEIAEQLAAVGFAPLGSRAAVQKQNPKDLIEIQASITPVYLLGTTEVIDAAAALRVAVLKLHRDGKTEATFNNFMDCRLAYVLACRDVLGVPVVDVDGVRVFD